MRAQVWLPPATTWATSISGPAPVWLATTPGQSDWAPAVRSPSWPLALEPVQRT